jgi:hypothetical protein
MRRALTGILLAAAVLAPDAGAVVGGGPASRPYPHMAQLRLDGRFICGGSVVAPQLVLTAAHCVTGGEDGRAPTASERLAITVGRTTLSGTDGSTTGVRAVEVHPGWDPGSFSRDVALLTLDRPVDAAPIALAGAAEALAAGRTATVVGWGARVSLLVVQGGTVDGLQEVDVPIQSDARCGTVAAGYDPAVMLCAGAPTGGRDACQGDSGGPLMVPDGRGGFLLGGVVSFGFGCGLPGQFGVYARAGAGELASFIGERLPRDEAPVGAPAPAAATGARLVLDRLRVAGRTARVRVRAGGEVRSVVARLVRRRGGRTTVLARATASRVFAARTLVLRARRPLPRSGLRLEVRARDAAGRQLRRTAAVPVRR